MAARYLSLLALLNGRGALAGCVSDDDRYAAQCAELIDFAACKAQIPCHWVPDARRPDLSIDLASAVSDLLVLDDGMLAVAAGQVYLFNATGLSSGAYGKLKGIDKASQLLALPGGGLAVAGDKVYLFDEAAVKSGGEPYRATPVGDHGALGLLADGGFVLCPPDDGSYYNVNMKFHRPTGEEYGSFSVSYQTSGFLPLPDGGLAVGMGTTSWAVDNFPAEVVASGAGSFNYKYWATTSHGNDWWIGDFRLLPGGQTLVVGMGDGVNGAVDLYKVQGTKDLANEPFQSLRAQGSIEAVAATPDGGIIAGSRKGTVDVFSKDDWLGGRDPSDTLVAPGWVSAVTALADGRLIVGTANGEILVYSASPVVIV